jgi:hypothetical protein
MCVCVYVFNLVFWQYITSPNKFIVRYTENKCQLNVEGNTVSLNCQNGLFLYEEEYKEAMKICSCLSSIPVR